MTRFTILLGIIAFLLALDLFAGTPFPQWDKNKDGKLAVDELPERAKKNFHKVDADKDGFITAAEDKAYRQRNQRVQKEAAAARNLMKGLQVKADLPYAASDNSRQTLDVLLPEVTPEKPLPLVVFIHGGGWKGGHKNSGRGKVARLVKTGHYIGATVGYRLSDEAKWPAQIHDCKAAIRWLRAHAETYHIDPERIAVMGSSAGGHLVAMLGTSGGVEKMEGDLGEHGEVSSRVDCVVNFFGPADFSTMNDVDSTIDHDAPDSPEGLLLGAAISDVPELAREVSPQSWITKDDAPFLHLHGTNDRLVPFQQSVVFHDHLKQAGVPSTLVTVKGGGHGFGGAEINEVIDRFLGAHLRQEGKAPEDLVIEK